MIYAGFRAGLVVGSLVASFPMAMASPLAGVTAGKSSSVKKPARMETVSAIEEESSVRTRAPAVDASFDSVPSPQIGPVTQRLKVVEEILTRFGRAYDYRSHTLRELQAILKQLDEVTRPDQPVDESLTDQALPSSDDAAGA
jgi:hypothetical protein